jgi:hypothetical protein
MLMMGIIPLVVSSLMLLHQGRNLV